MFNVHKMSIAEILIKLQVHTAQKTTSDNEAINLITVLPVDSAQSNVTLPAVSIRAEVLSVHEIKEKLTSIYKHNFTSRAAPKLLAQKKFAFAIAGYNSVEQTYNNGKMLLELHLRDKPGYIYRERMSRV